jgi:hypothetical protein
MAMFNQLAKLAKKVKGAAKGFSRVASEASDDAVTQVGKTKVAKTKATGTPGIAPDMTTAYIHASQVVEDILHNGKLLIGGDEAFQKAVEADLRKIACTNTGKTVLNDIAKSPNRVIIEPWPPGHTGNSAMAHSDDAFRPGVGSDTTVRYNPDGTGRPPGSPPDAGLMHELGHGRNNATGMNAVDGTPPGGFDRNQWSNMEEYNNINNVDNPYRDEWGLPNRTGHNHLP